MYSVAKLAHSRAFRDNLMAPAVTARFAGRRDRLCISPPRSPLPDPGLDDLSSSPVRPSFLLYTERVSFRSFSPSHTLLSCKHRQDLIYHRRSFPTRTVAVPSLSLFPLLSLLRSFFTPAPCLSFTSHSSFLHIWIPTATATHRPDSCNAPAPRPPTLLQGSEARTSVGSTIRAGSGLPLQPTRSLYTGARLPFAAPARIPAPRLRVGLRRKRHNATHCSRRTAISWKLHPHTLHW